MTEDTQPEDTQGPPTSIAALAGITKPNTTVDMFCDRLLAIYAGGEPPGPEAAKDFDALKAALRRFRLYTVRDVLNMPLGQATSLDKATGGTQRISTECKRSFLEAIEAVSLAFKAQRKQIYTDPHRSGAREHPLNLQR